MKSKILRQTVFASVLATLLFTTAAAEEATSPAADGFTIVEAERLTLNLPFSNERVRRHMRRSGNRWERVILYRVELANGVVGWGESPLHTPPERLENVIGRNAFEFLNTGRLRFGVEMALVDAIGRSVDLPAHVLIGRKRRDRVPIAWWMIDMPPEDWQEEVLESVRRGYTSAKIKARPWWDLVEQLEAIAEVAPANYRVMIDYNGFLLNAENALQYLKQFDDMPLVEGHESPIYFGTDYDGVRMLTEKIKKPIVDHFQERHILENVGDGFLLEVSTRTLPVGRRQNTLCSAWDKPHWLQMVGTGIMTAYAAHVGSVFSHARMASVTCHEIWEHDLLKERIEIVNGFMRVPEAPGLGVEVDEEAIRRYQVDPDTPTLLDIYNENAPKVRITIPQEDADDMVLIFDNEREYYHRFLRGEFPVFVRGARLETVEQD